MRFIYTVLLLVLSASAFAAGQSVLQTFTVKDYLQHQWTNELVHFPVSYAGTLPKSLTLLDAAGTSMPCQVEAMTRKDGKVTGTLWTVVTVPPKGDMTLKLQAGTSATTDLRLLSRGNELWLGNGRMMLRLPRFPTALKAPVEITTLPAPVLAMSADGGATWLAGGNWVNGGDPVLVKAAVVSVIEAGPVRITVRYRLTFADDRYYQADITLGARQDAALFTDETTLEAPKAAFRISFQPGMNADRVFWQNNYYADSYKGLSGDPVSFNNENVVCSLCPWSFWWLQDRTNWAGIYRQNGEPFIGLIALKPSRWSPTDWDGYDRTIIPITARQGGGLDATLGLLAWNRKLPDGTEKFSPARRELALTAGKASDYLDLKRMDILKLAVTAKAKNDMGEWNRLLGEGLWQFKLRQQLIQYSEFPLDEVKDFGFGTTLKTSGVKHPFLLVTPADIERARKQAKTNTAEQAALEKATRYMAGLGCDPVAKITGSPDGWQKFYKENYVANWLYECSPQAYIGSDDPKYGIILSAGVKGLATAVVDQFLNAPGRSSIGQNAHLGTTGILQLLLAYDLLADSPYLTAEDKAFVQAALIFGAYVTDHPDYWNTDLGLCSANPNMTSLMKLPLGLLALYLDGHPLADKWLKRAEDELQSEIRTDWIAPGGAWLECPFYQSASLDGMFMLAQALKNVRGTDYFVESQFKATMDYYGYILTPPDRRFPPNTPNSDGYMTVPSIGDAFPGFTTTFNGWMAKATEKSDPAFSARQQFYWRGQAYSQLNGGRAGSMAMALCDTDLPATPPIELAKAFPGFGNILRSSWTEPKASYVSQRCGTFSHHFDLGDYNSIQYFAKGAPLLVDFGHRGATGAEVTTMWRPDYHSAVSFNRAPDTYWGPSGGPIELNHKAQEVRCLPRTLIYSAGLSYGSGNQQDVRHVLLVQSDDPLGATYLVMRDQTQDGQPNQTFTWNLWVMAKEPQITGSTAHFPGLYGVDLDAHLLWPAGATLTKDAYKYKEWVHPWGFFEEEETAVRAHKAGSTDDFLALLYPRAAGQGASQVTLLGTDRGVKITHMEGTDYLLFSPGKAASIQADNGVRLRGEIALSRTYTDGRLRLAVMRGDGVAGINGWVLGAGDDTAIEVNGARVTGESNGAKHSVQILSPRPILTATVSLDGKPIAATVKDTEISFDMPDGTHTFTIDIK